MARTLRTVLLLAALALTAGAALAAEEKAPARPNFLVILCDDLGYGDLGCYGHPTIRTPHLDRLASQGLRLTSCYAAAPVCSPSRAGLLAGRNPNRLGVYDWIPPGSPMHLGSDETTVARYLQQAGYATCQVGKWHCNGQFNKPDQPQPGDHGFDHWFATQNNAAPDHHDPTNFVRNGQPVGKTEGYSCQVVADEAIRWLRDARPADRPFFQYVCFHEPHEPIASPPGLAETYAAAGSPNQALYYANVTNMDAAVGRLMTALDELKLTDNTFVLFTSDNGPETLNRYPGASRSYGSPGPLRGMKLHLYEGGIRVPGIIRWPGHARPGTTADEPVSSVDLLPTFCAIAGVQPATTPRHASTAEPAKVLDGANLMPLFDTGRIPRTTPLWWFYSVGLGRPRMAMRDGDWKICATWDVPADRLQRGGNAPAVVKSIKGARLVEFELYNLRDDIGEKHDRAAGEPQRLQRMAGQLREIFTQMQRECPDPWGR